MTKYTDKITQTEREIARLGRLQGTPLEPVSCGAQISILQRRLAWYERRQDRRPRNVGTRSLARVGRPAGRTTESPLPVEISA